MKKTIFSIIFSVAIIGAAIITSTLAAGSDGKSIFISQGCNGCHSVPSVKIASTSAKSIALPRHSRSAGWYTSWLQKKVLNEGKKHVKSWKGSSDDLTILTAWLAGLK